MICDLVRRWNLDAGNLVLEYREIILFIQNYFSVSL